MKIDHLAIWVHDLEKMKDFYCKFFGAVPGDLYHNPTKSFTSYFLSFDEGCRLELMYKPSMSSDKNEIGIDHIGLIHFAVNVGSKAKVDSLTEILRNDGFTIQGDPRTTGDGYYESVVLDPEGNKIEITI